MTSLAGRRVRDANSDRFGRITGTFRTADGERMVWVLFDSSPILWTLPEAEIHQPGRTA